MTLYSCFVSCFSSTVRFIIVSVMLYARSLAHLALYMVLMRSAGNSSRGRLVTMHSYVAVCVNVCQNFFRMTPDQYNVDINIEGFLIWKIKIANQSFGMDILGTEQEILSLFRDVCHVVIRAIPAVTGIDIFSSIQNIVTVNHITESTEFIFAADGLDQRICVCMCIQVKESIQVHAVDTVGRVSRGTVIVW